MPVVGSGVLVRSLKRPGVVVEVVRPGVYRVQVGAMTVTAREEDIEVPAPSKKRRPKPAPAERTQYESPQAGLGPEPDSMDLHGLTVDEARNRVAGYISRAILSGLDRVEIIHGIGSGKLKAAVTKDLKSIAAVRAVKLHPTNPGVTVVFL